MPLLARVVVRGASGSERSAGSSAQFLMVIWLQSVQRDGYDPGFWLALGDGIFRHVLPPSRNEGRPSPTRLHGGGLQGVREARRRLGGMVHGSLSILTYRATRMGNRNEGLGARSWAHPTQGDCWCGETEARAARSPQS